MDHIIADFELSSNRVPSVPNLTEPSTIFPNDWASFQSYPRDNGWRLDEDTYNLKLLSTDAKAVTKLQFVQSWLFFGLIMTIVQQDGRPILEYQHLVEDDRSGDSLVTTKLLSEALDVWSDWERGRRDLGNLSEIRLRMVRVDAVLNAARRTIRANYGHSSGNNATDKVALSLMILGETLSSFKTQILKITQSGLKGWHSEDDNGWGLPAYILERMDREKWCRKTVHLWQNQFRASATLMLASYLAYSPLDRYKGTLHKDCTERDCKAISQDDKGSFGPAHTHLCTTSCSMIGPDMTAIRDYINNEQIPLLQFRHPPVSNATEGQLDLAVVAISENESKDLKYATISHVWSDGFGNENGNELHRCQLLHIRRILDMLDPENGWNTPFWMDTLIIPVRRVAEDKALRKRAIKQIFRVFKESSYTIVLDAGLSQMYPGSPDKPAVAAMRILGSSWMRRLWTLQEAFLSRKIYFAFDDHLEVSQKLGSDSDTEGTTAILNMVNVHLQRLTMSHEHETLDRYLLKRRGSSFSKMPQERTALLVASYIGAARWRATSTASHETLALATLLDLDYENANNFEDDVKQVHDEWRGRQVAEKDRLVQDFWTQFNKRWPKSIPPGIIFLPGERVGRVGFGWALRTWMNDLPTDYPDPLTLFSSTAELDTDAESGLDGLKVQYPGFLLHPQHRRLILATDKQTRRRFWFPTSPSFLDWYMVEPMDDDVSVSFIHKISESQDRLGIIVPRAKPGDILADIGLLVQIREEKTTEMRASRFTFGTTEELEPLSRSSPPVNSYETKAEAHHLYCEIVRRVKVSRETRSEFRTRNLARFLVSTDTDVIPIHRRLPSPRTPVHDDIVPEVMTDSEDAHGIICLAEELGPEQVWFVDGFFPRRHDSSVGNGIVSDFAPTQDLRKRLLRLFTS